MVETLFSTDKALIDLAAIDADALDVAKIGRDCDLVKEAARSDPAALKQMVAALQRGGSEGIEEAGRLAERLGITEDQAVKAGGGLLFLVAVAVVAVAASGCATCNSHKGLKPAQPKSPPGGGPQ